MSLLKYGETLKLLRISVKWASSYLKQMHHWLSFSRTETQKRYFSKIQQAIGKWRFATN